MPRVKRGTVRRAKRKKLLKRAKGYYATKSKLYQAAQEAVDKALNYAYSGRRRKKRDFRRLWVVRINAAARANGLTYGELINGLKTRRRRAGPQEPRRSRGEPSGGIRAAWRNRRSRDNPRGPREDGSRSPFHARPCPRSPTSPRSALSSSRRSRRRRPSRTSRRCTTGSSAARAAALRPS